MALTARLCPQLATVRGLIHEYLCPILVPSRLSSRRLERPHPSKPTDHGRRVHTESSPVTRPDLSTHAQLLNLPWSCPGCGAYTQVVSPDQAGFYSASRKSVKEFITQTGQPSNVQGLREDELFNRVLGSADSSLRSRLGFTAGDGSAKSLGSFASQMPHHVPTPMCNRCHHLQHHHNGVSVVHPTLQSIQETISESPHKYNHIYHILDAADFPLSLIPSLQRRLSLSPQRSQNRRAKTTHFQYGRIAEMSFIISRSDLLAPKKDQVDSLMPYIVQVLRDALGATAEEVRLGNVHCVSSKRGWWTKEVKEKIWDRGGGGWMVGKVNVGKSNLFENIFPKGRTEDISFDALRHAAKQAPQTARSSPTTSTADTQAAASPQTPQEPLNDQVLPLSLLPPSPPEIPFPTLPLVSSLPGTTASPIRLPYGSGKGELIDLPGLARNDLSEHVLPAHQDDLVMRARTKPIQHSLNPGQSLLIGGLIRITPLGPGLTILAYPFLPLQCHVTSTEKAIAVHSQQQPSGISSIAKAGLGPHLKSAGRFALKHDITKSRAGPLTAKAAAGLSTHVLPFFVFSADILIEGCGWVELTAQVRKKDFEAKGEGMFDDRPYPEVEVVSPGGGHVGVRRPMGAWGLC